MCWSFYLWIQNMTSNIILDYKSWSDILQTLKHINHAFHATIKVESVLDTSIRKLCHNRITGITLTIATKHLINCSLWTWWHTVLMCSLAASVRKVHRRLTNIPSSSSVCGIMGRQQYKHCRRWMCLYLSQWDSIDCCIINPCVVITAWVV